MIDLKYFWFESSKAYNIRNIIIQVIKTKVVTKYIMVV